MFTINQRIINLQSLIKQPTKGGSGMKYFLIHNSDGNATVRTFTKEELIQEIKDMTEDIKPEYMPIFIDERFETDTNYWSQRGYLLIKGEVVQPKPIKVVTEYSID